MSDKSESSVDLADEDVKKKFEAACDDFPRYFDEDEFVTETILPLWKQIHALCAERAIPVVFSLCYMSDEEQSKHSSGMVIPGKRCPEILHRVARLVQTEGADDISFTRNELFAALKGLKSLGKMSHMFGG